MTQMSTCLWFAKDAEAAARQYCAAIAGSRIDAVIARPSGVPGKEGEVMMVTFTLAGAPMLAFNAEPPPGFTNAVSLVVSCDDQAELDRVWDALLDGGEAQACGWLKDRFGVAWQVVPEALPRLMTSGTPDQRARTMAALMDMVKIDAAALEAAHATA
ncbi:VOC family protein [Roseomonas sp. PWR1]|uniref:VOC family protein n=1 Tax=Roseomonas nitratireducens TaxID=2820810 RepID=A0ABS4ARA6_9PROT|nr:VOC family protein [Neoroseomonas nitratireducens]MBP0463890.1 VOC family protein [Neoroseomonas nitratireducens]